MARPAARPASGNPSPDRRPRSDFFSPFAQTDGARRCASCRHAIGWDSAQLFCQRAAIVPVYPCSHWEREAGCD